MTIASSLHTMSNGSGSSSTNPFLLPKNDLTAVDSQLIDVLLHSQNNETKIQVVNRWCKNSRHNRLLNIIDVSQRYDILLSLVNTLQQTTNTEYQYNCLTLLTELQNNIHHYDQRLYLPAIIQTYSSTSNDVQTLVSQFLTKQLHSTDDIPTFLHIYTQDGLKSPNIRICVKSIEGLTDILTKSHHHENLSPIFELLLHYLQDNKFRLTYNNVLVQSINHIKYILGTELLTTYLDSYSPALKRLYYTYISEQTDNDETPRATIQVSHIKDSNNYSHTGTNGFRTNNDNTFSVQNDVSDVNSLIETIRLKWMQFDETNRANYFEHLRNSCDKYVQTLSSKYPSLNNPQFHQVLYTFLASLLDLLSYVTSTNLDLSIRIKLVLSTCLAWLIKHAQKTFCKQHYKTICVIFKNIVFNGQSNNRQLAKLSVNIILLLENFVHPQVILDELVDDQYQYLNYRIQLEILAIVTATFLKNRHQRYDNIANLNKYLLPMLISNRRELRHGAMECFTVICVYLNSFKPLTSANMESNQSIKLILLLIENLSHDALNAFRFRLQRNLLPSLTDEGNITPGLVCDSTTTNDPDAKYILLVSSNKNSSVQTPQSTTSNDSSSIPSSSSSLLSANNSKLLQFAMPFVDKRVSSNDSVMRSREIPPLKPTNVDLDSHRYTNNNHTYETTVNPTVLTTVTTGGSPFDFTVTGNNNYRPLTLTERVFTDDWAKKLSTTNIHRKEPLKTVQQQENQQTNSLLQFRPVIPHRPTIGRFPASHNILATSQIHNHNEQKSSGHHAGSATDHDDGIGSAIESRSLPNNITNHNTPETNGQRSKKAPRSVHSSSTRRKVNLLFNNGTDIDSSSVRTLTPENSNESGVYSQSGRDTEYNSTSSTRSAGNDQLFNTKPRLARSGSKPKSEKPQVLPSDPSIGQNNENHSSVDKTRRSNNNHVEVVGRAYADEKIPVRRFSSDRSDEKQQPIVTKPRSKIIKGSVVTNPSNTNNEDGSNRDDGQDIGVVGRAVPMPLRTNGDMDTIRVQNNNSINNKLNKQGDNTDTLSDEFDSDSKENENFVSMGQTLSASFRLRVQQKTQEKIEQKERRRQDRESRSRQQEQSNNHNNNNNRIAVPYDNDAPTSSSTSRYSSQPDLTAINNDVPSTPRQIDSNINSILPSFPKKKSFRASKNFMARSQTFNNRRDTSSSEQNLTAERPSSEDRTEILRNPDIVYREAMESIASDDWEQKCSGLNLLQLLTEQYPDTITQNLHQVVLVLIQEVKNLRSQVARFALSTFCDMFKHLRRNMDIELDITVKAIIQKSAESNEFFRSDAEKCLQTMVENVTPQKALQALIAGGASHRNPAARKTSAKCIYLVCEKLGPTKILSGTRDITERVLQVGATFASDGPPEIRWYGKKIYHMLMPFDELDSMMKHYLNPSVYTNMCEILDNIRAKGGVGETPSESARNNGRRTLSNDKLGSNGNLTSQFPSTRKINNADQAEQVRDLTKQMRSSDFRERLNGIEEFQKLCELETDTAIQSLVQIFDGFNDCLADMNSKVVLKALNTMHQVIPILGDALSSVINSALPIIAQNIASKNREISQLASEIIDTAIEYIDCGVLIQPLCTLSQNSNLRIRPEIVLKLANLAPRVCQRKPKQVEIHLLPTFWKLLSLLRGQMSTNIAQSASGSNSLNSSIHVLTMALYAELGSVLLEKASSSSSVTPQNLQLLRELCTNISAE